MRIICKATLILCIQTNISEGIHLFLIPEGFPVVGLISYFPNFLKDASLFPSVYIHISVPSGVAPKSLRLADPCLPPVIQCDVLEEVQQLVHIIPQHAPSACDSAASLLLP